MVDHRNPLGGKTCHIAFAVLTVNRNEKIRRGMELVDMNKRDLKALQHHQDVQFLNDILTGVDQPYFPALIRRERLIQSKS